MITACSVTSKLNGIDEICETANLLEFKNLNFTKRFFFLVASDSRVILFI